MVSAKSVLALDPGECKHFYSFGRTIGPPRLGGRNWPEQLGLPLGVGDVAAGREEVEHGTEVRDFEV